MKSTHVPAQILRKNFVVKKENQMSFKSWILMLSVVSGLMGSNSLALRLNVKDRDNMTTSQSQKLDQAVTVLNQVLNGPDFKDRILNFTYNGQKAFVQNNGMSNQQVYDFLMSGAEQYPVVTPANDLADVNLTIYYPPFWKAFSSAVAFTSESDPYLHIYNRYYNKASIPEISNTIIHEWTHKMGFDHDFNSTAQRPYSVPYAVGTIVNDLVVKFLGKK